MSFAGARYAVEKYLGTFYTETPLYVENQQRPKRDDDPPAEWAALSISEQAVNQVTTGPNPRFVAAGLAIVQIFTPLGGLRIARRSAELFDALAALLRGVELEAGQSGRLSFRAPYHVPAGESDGWWQDNLYAPYARSFTASLAQPWNAADPVSWTPLVLTSPWVNVAGEPAAAYRFDYVADRVELRGVVHTNGASVSTGDPILSGANVLPARRRPLARVLYDASDRALRVETTGAITFQGPNGVPVPIVLNNLSFLADGN